MVSRMNAVEAARHHISPRSFQSDDARAVEAVPSVRAAARAILVWSTWSQLLTC
jgi:hypothetical protein